VLSVVFLSVMVNFVFAADDWTEALPLLVHTSNCAITRRSGALCVSVMIQPFMVGLPVPVKLSGGITTLDGVIVVPPDCGVPVAFPPGREQSEPWHRKM
jgi:hypothetical protein